MALLDLGEPPELVPLRHTDYRPWLEWACFDRVCAYCLENAQKVEVDHVEPESHAPARVMDPTNLLPACALCNGPHGKWDYHPLRSPRKKCPKDTHGYLALDPRSDDVAELYAVRTDGALDVHDGATYARALWNRDVLFRLNRSKLKQWRAEAQQLAEVAEHLVAEVKAHGDAAPAEQVRRRDVMVGVIAQRLPFFVLFELPLSAELLERAQARRDELRGPKPG